MLAPREYTEIRGDYDEKSRRFSAPSYRPPVGLSFADSAALFPDDELRRRLAVDYDEQCRVRFSDRDFPSFADVLARFVEIRPLL